MAVGAWLAALPTTVIAQPASGSGALAAVRQGPVRAAVHPVFDLSSPSTSPFPSNWYTVPDTAQATGRRVALPMPSDCVANASDCEDIQFLNLLDGFNVIGRISIPFDGDISVSTATSENIFLIAMGDSLQNASGEGPADDDDSTGPTGRVVGINQVVWDPAPQTLHATVNEMLDEHAVYALVVTSRVRDTAGIPIAPSVAYEAFRRGTVRGGPQQVYYRRAIRTAQKMARATGLKNREIAAISVFTTQSASYLSERVAAQVRGGVTSPATDFNLGPGGTRSVFTLSALDATTPFTWNRQTALAGPLSPLPAAAGGLALAPGAIARVAVGRITAPDFMVHPGEYIPEVPTGAGGVPAVQGTQTLSVVVTLPSSPRPAAGWPVAIYGHRAGASNIADTLNVATILASRGIAVVAVDGAGNGFGPNSTLTANFANGTRVTVPLPGLGIDQDGDGAIGPNEGEMARVPRTLQRNADAHVQTAAHFHQLVRAIGAGVDVDGDGATDLDAGRIYYFSHSQGAILGPGFVAFAPEVRAADFTFGGGPLLENRRLAPADRGPAVGVDLAARTPSLLNSAVGLTSLGGVPTTAPFFNENLPLRDQPPVVNTVPGAIAIQQWLDRSRWILQRANPMVFAALLRRRPPPGVPARPVMFQMIAGDQASPNVNQSNVVHAGGLEDRTAYFRYDRWLAVNPGPPKNAHALFINYGQVAWRPVMRDFHEQVAEFFASDGANFVTPPALPAYWEVPIAALPWGLNYIP